nr:hypothetical protein [Haloferax sp. ATB1]
MGFDVRNLVVEHLFGGLDVIRDDAVVRPRVAAVGGSHRTDSAVGLDARVAQLVLFVLGRGDDAPVANDLGVVEVFRHRVVAVVVDERDDHAVVGLPHPAVERPRRELVVTVVDDGVFGTLDSLG